MNKKRKIIISIALALAIFIFDALTVREYATWALYIIPLLFVAPAVPRSYIPLLALGGTVLIVFDFIVSPGQPFTTTAVLNRALGIFTIWAALLLLRRQKLTEEALARSNKDLEQFAYAVSHDLQEPLRNVSSYVELLAMRYKGKLDENADKYIHFAVEGTSRMSSLINDLLVYSRIGTQGKPFGKVDMNAVLREAINNLRKAIHENRAEITSDKLPAVIGDDTQLVQLLQNLIGNAIKFRKKKVQPRIHVSAARKGSEWVFGVHDNGIGIETRFYDRIFTVFQRLHTKEEYPGTGIGLAVCRRVVERHTGRIWVESKRGEGSTFYFRLPEAKKYFKRQELVGTDSSREVKELDANSK